jgi:MoaA/NifB/PqqE/SkfB family radical SAM enzyme
MKSSVGAGIALRSILSMSTHRPICVSFEVTHSCPADCMHCDKGGLRDEPSRLGPADYARLSAELKPAVCQLSGGEPLLRDDLEDVARATKRRSGLPLLICVTSAWLLTEARYLALCDAGVDIFSISLDFPDNRHDEFRRIRGLYEKLSSLIPALVSRHRRGNIALNTALTQANFACIPELVAQAEAWGVRISFSAYSPLRTRNLDLCITSPEDKALLARHLDYVVEHSRRSDTIINSPYTLAKTKEFFLNGGHLGGCRAGERFLVVRPDGRMNACSMHPDHQYLSQREALRGFTVRESCDQCYVTIRAATERPPLRALSDSLSSFIQLRS